MDRVVPASPIGIEVVVPPRDIPRETSYEQPVPPLYTKKPPDKPIYSPPSIHSITSTSSTRSGNSASARGCPPPHRSKSKSSNSSKNTRKGSSSSERRRGDSIDAGYLTPPVPHQVRFASDVESGDDLDEEETPRQRRRRRRRWKKKAQGMDYLVDDVPPWYLCVTLAVQHLVVMFGATVAMPIALERYLCLGPNDTDVVGNLIGTMFFCAGMSTLLQTTIGIRLPIVQGGAFSFLPPSISLLSMSPWNCTNATALMYESYGLTNASLYNATANITDAPVVDVDWKTQLCVIQGGILIASVVQFVIGVTGVTGFILRYLGPIAVAPTVALIGLSLFQAAVDYAKEQWWITMGTVVLIAGFSQYSKNLNVPCYEFKRGKGCQKVPFPLFRLYPVLLAVALSWILYVILVETGVLPSTHSDKLFQNLFNAKWFRFPYPFQWGYPIVTVAGVFGMMAAVFASVAESMGDYYACARISFAAPPPTHAVNRGICVEGICMLLAGLWGTGSGTTSYSENIGAIGITKVASRRVMQFAAIAMIFLGMFGKLGVFFSMIPGPVIGGVFIVMFGMVTAVGLSNLQFVDLNSTRNLFIIGCAFFMGLSLPKFISDNNEMIRTGNDVVNQVVIVLFTTDMFVGGIVAFVLDNTIPGTDEERGLIKWREYTQVDDRQQRVDEANGMPTRAINTYDIPWLRMCLAKNTWTQYLPFLPNFKEEMLQIRRKKKKRKSTRANSGNSTAEDIV